MHDMGNFARLLMMLLTTISSQARIHEFLRPGEGGQVRIQDFCKGGPKEDLDNIAQRSCIGKEHLDHNIGGRGVGAAL